MSDPGKGRPIDDLDAVCKQYKDCQKCAREEFGDMCIGESVEYNYGQTGGEKYCKGDSGTCGRKLCECDLQFAKAHVAAKDVFDSDYHLFWTSTGWDADEPANCPRPHGTAQPECCGRPDGPSSIYNSLASNRCCVGGDVVSC